MPDTAGGEVVTGPLDWMA